MRRLTLSVVAGLVAMAASARAQAGSPVTDALRANVKSAARNFVAAATDMPADKYGYHPTEAQRTFGALVLHVAGSNDFMCASISGEKAPARSKLTATSSKDELVAAVRASFGFCESAFAKLTDSGLSDSVPFFGGRKTTRAAMILDIAADWADHYGTAADYMRMNGILPPTARGRGGM